MATDVVHQVIHFGGSNATQVISTETGIENLNCNNHIFGGRSIIGTIQQTMGLLYSDSVMMLYTDVTPCLLIHLETSDGIFMGLCRGLYFLF